MTIILRNLSFLLVLCLLQSCSHGPTYSTIPARAGAYTISGKRSQAAAGFRTELLTSERRVPASYLAVAGTYHRDFTGQLILAGNISSKASLATFKDPVLAVTWYSQAHTKIGTQQYPLYNLLRPQSSAHFELETAAPAEVASVALGIASATSVE